MTANEIIQWLDTYHGTLARIKKGGWRIGVLIAVAPYSYHYYQAQGKTPRAAIAAVEAQIASDNHKTGSHQDKSVTAAQHA